MRKLFFAILLLSCTMGYGKKEYPYQNKKFTIEKRVSDLLKRMTLQEKIAEMNLRPYYENRDKSIKEALKKGEIGALLKANGVKKNRELQKIAVENSRLGIPLVFHEDVIHGYRTITPIPLAASCCWDKEMIRETAEVAAIEAAAAGIQLTYAPMVDISSDPRWGRIMETSGEDPYLCSQLAEARVEGFQGKDLKTSSTIAACIKHFAGYAALSAGRDYQNTDFSLRDLQEIYLPPYKAAIASDVASVMCSYTSYDGEPVTMNYFMNTTTLRKQLKFKGLLMTDWTTFNHVVTEGAAKDGKEAAMRGVLSGIEMDMSSNQFHKNIEQLIKEKKISIKQINKAAKHALKLKFQLGLFDDPYRYFDEKRESTILLSQTSKDKAYKIAVNSMVLLKNEKNILPINQHQKIAVVGPYTTNKKDLFGSWSMKGRSSENISMIEGLNELFPNNHITALGCEWNGLSKEYINSAVSIANNSDIIIACLGEKSSVIGEAVSTAKLELPNNQIELLRQLKKSGKKIVVVLFNGRPLILNELVNYADAILEAWYPGTMTGKAVAALLSGKENPSAKLTQSFPRHVGQVPIAYNQRRTFHRVNHADLPVGPLFPFGFGLSYTNYSYSSIQLDKTKFKFGETIKLSVKVKNIGKKAGREIVQLYVRDKVATIIPREKELKGFQSIYLQPNEEKEVVFTLSSDELKLWNNKMKYVNELGEYDFMIGTNSQEYLSIKGELISSKSN